MTATDIRVGFYALLGIGGGILVIQFLKQIKGAVS
jgi:hypothetical protein